jgi:hypothetical protein
LYIIKILISVVVIWHPLSLRIEKWLRHKHTWVKHKHLLLLHHHLLHHLLLLNLLILFWYLLCLNWLAFQEDFTILLRKEGSNVRRIVNIKIANRLMFARILNCCQRLVGFREVNESKLSWFLFCRFTINSCCWLFDFDREDFTKTTKFLL